VKTHSDTSAAKQVNHNIIKPFKALSKHFLLLSKVRQKHRFVPRSAWKRPQKMQVLFKKWMLYSLPICQQQCLNVSCKE